VFGGFVLKFVHDMFPIVLVVLFVVLYSVHTGHQDHAVGGSQVWCVNAGLVSPSSNLGQRYTVLFCVVVLYYFILFSFRSLCIVNIRLCCFLSSLSTCVCSHHW